MQNGGSGRVAFLLASFLVLTSLVASGAPVFAGAVCGSGPTDSGVLNYKDVAGDLGGGGCDFGDKTFSGFSAPPFNGLNLQFTQVGNAYTITFTGNLTNSFTIAYDVAVNSGPATITKVSAGIDLSDPASTASLTKTVTVGGASCPGPGCYELTVNNTVVGGTATADIHPPTTSLHVVDAYTGDTPPAVSFSNTFFQTVIPEPGTIGLIGMGLLGLAVIGGRKLARQ